MHKVICHHCGKTTERVNINQYERGYCNHACYVAHLRDGNSRLKKPKLQKICIICGMPFETKPSNARIKSCSFECGRIAISNEHRQKTESAFGMPLAQLLHSLYIERELSVRQILGIIPVSTRTLLRWLDECGIPKRKGSVAVRQQWKNNESRRKEQSARAKQMFVNGRNDPTRIARIARTPEARRRNSESKKGAKNVNYGKLGPASPSWKGGKITEYGPGWRSIRKMVRRRDGDKCVRCGSKKQLEVHHIVPYRLTQDNSLENLVTLCHICHERVEHYGETWQLTLLEGHV